MNRQDRRSDFKKGVDLNDGRRRRTETNVQLRKNKKEEGIAKRRAMTSVPNSLPVANTINTATTSSSKKIYTVDDIPSLTAALRQPNINDDKLVEIVQGFRKLLSVENNPPVEKVLESGVLPALVQMLALHDKSTVQFEAAWALTNIASTDYTKVVVEAGAVPLFVQLLSSPSAEIREQSAWCLGNIAGDSYQLRDIVLTAGAVQPLLQNIVSPASNSLFSNCVWTLSNFCRGKPVPELNLVACALPTLANILNGTNDEAKTDALWALSYISDGDDARIQSVLDAGVVNNLIDLLGSDNQSVVTPALRTVGNIVSGSDDQTQMVVNAGLLTKMEGLLDSPRVRFTSSLFCFDHCTYLNSYANFNSFTFFYRK